MKFSVLSRKLHRWGAVTTAVPLLVVILSGVLLQLKKEWSWVQPPTRSGSGIAPRLDFDSILAASQQVEKAQIRGWDDIDRLDVRPDRGLVKVRAKSGFEVQLDSTSGEVLQTAYRRSDLIESLHDGSFFADWVKLGIFLPSAILLFGLWCTGVYLWILPHRAKRKRKRAVRL